MNRDRETITLHSIASCTSYELGQRTLEKYIIFRFSEVFDQQCLFPAFTFIPDYMLIHNQQYKGPDFVWHTAFPKHSILFDVLACATRL
uniref:Uncharacterized protein n=1 Tax=Arundo donax TaxID=35708 RepID=A0A0A9H055_ARUDO